VTTARLVILVADEYQERILEVMENLQSLGMQIDRFMEITGVITGVISTTQMELLKNVEGIAAIELAQDFQLTPPESDVQ
jgi:hypothetical protein